MSSPRHSYRGVIRDLLKRQTLRTLFQPIFSLSSPQVFGYEALSRGPANHQLSEAEQLFDAAARAGLTREVNSTLAWLARVRAQQRIDSSSALLFINLDADNFHPAASHIFDWQSDRLWPLERTVIELTERVPIRDIGSFVRLRDYARDLGVRFALDDAGAGYAGLGTLATLRPDFIKVDASLTRNCDANNVKQSIIASLHYLGKQTGAELIVEGVETVTELATLREIGVDLVQGFLMAAPDETPSSLDGMISLNAHRRTPAGSRDGGLVVLA